MGTRELSSKMLFLETTVIFLLLFQYLTCIKSSMMSKEEREDLKEEARDMFYHAYRAYMENAYPADELMPLSCAGRYRGLAPNRGDMDDILGNFSLTLIDTLDTLVILGDLEEFEHAVSLIIKDVSFENDIIVSVFETNIRVLGGLLSGHILAEYLQQRAGILQWYRGELLSLAKDIGYRLLPAFNTTTGIPHARVNLKYGMKSERLEMSRETCTACAGTMILEMAALSRLTGEPIFEEKAHRAMDELWKMRHRSSDLMGTILNVHSGDWIRRDSGVGAGIDSYYEYCLKAYILLGDERYLNRFNRHYTAVMKYISQGPMLLDVHMHRPHTNSRNFMDALLAFWPGLQVLKGDIKPAVETHEMLYQVMQRHNFIPEAFTTDFQVHWGQHPLRPEFLESTYFLHRATNDPYYLEVGRSVLKSLQKYARVSCGYAAVNDVRTGKHEDRMDSFVLAETFKYLFLLFTDEKELILDLNEFLFTTEAHLLPLSLGAHTNHSLISTLDQTNDLELDDTEFSRTCPNTFHLFPESVRRPLRNMVDGVCPRIPTKRRLTAVEFQVSDPQHMNIIKNMGINILALSDGRIQLLHTFSTARSPSDAEEGLMFMQEMVELSRAQASQPEAQPQGIMFSHNGKTIILSAGPSHFGPELRGNEFVSGRVCFTLPFRACEDIDKTYAKGMKGNIAIVSRGDCMFVEKARRIQKAGAIAGIIIDNTFGSSAATSPMFAMSGDGHDDVKIPVVFLFYDDSQKLKTAIEDSTFNLEVTIGDLNSLKSHHQSEPQKIKSPLNKVLQSKKLPTSEIGAIMFRGFTAVIQENLITINYKTVDHIYNLHEYSNIIVHPKWKKLRKKILSEVLSDKKTCIITRNIISYYYRYSKKSVLERFDSDIIVQVQWLLSELQEELRFMKTLRKGRKNKIDELFPLQDWPTKIDNNVKVIEFKSILERIQNNIVKLEELVLKEVENSEKRTGGVTIDKTNDDIITTKIQIKDEL